MHGFWPLLACASKISRIVTASRAGCSRLFGGLLLLLCAGFAPTAFAATGTCGAAASQGVNGPADYPTYCWIDFTGYNNTTASSAGGQAFTITLTGGSTLSFTLKVTGPALTSTAVPTWTGAALGQSAFITIPGKPALYQTVGAGTTTVTLSNLVLTVGSGTVPYAIVAADAESTNNGENLSFTTNGNAWTLLASMAYTGSTTFPTLAGVGTTTVTETGVNGNVGAYAFATEGSPTTISSSFLGSGLQGIAFAVKFHAVDFAIASGHTGSFNAGGTGSYTLTATNDGPDQYAPTDTVTVTDTLPTGETYVSASGSGWSCGAVGQLVTCTASNVTVNSGSSLPAITLNVSVAANAAASLTNTATVASNPNLDYNLTNNTTTDVTTIVTPSLINSTKTVVNTGGGDAVVGGTLQYTITLTESAGIAAVGASVVDDVPANLSNFTVVSFPSGATNSSTGTGGANGDGQLNITGINVPANGSVTVVFTAKVATGTANCTEIDNTATVNTPNGTLGATPSSTPIVVAQSSCKASGNKILYVYDSQALTRVAQTATTTGVTVGEASTLTWTMSPAFQKAFTLSAGTVTVQLVTAGSGSGNPNNSRDYTVSILKNGTVLGTSASSGNFTSTALTLRTSTVTIPTATTFAVGDTLNLRVNNNSTGGGTRTIVVAQLAAAGRSTVSFATTTVINVDSVNVYNAVYPATTQSSYYTPGTTAYICAVISDPFGSNDVTSATVTLTDANGTVQVSNAAMTNEGAKDCANNASTSSEAFEYAYTLGASGTIAVGNWTAAVTGNEGTEGTVSHTANGTFAARELPSLTIMKSVLMSADPTGDTIVHSIPGATAQYTVTVLNSGRGPVDSGTLIISDPVPTDTALSLGNTAPSPPFTFSDPGNTTGLTVSANYGSIVFSNNGGTTYTYTPTCTRPCTDSTITNFKITLNGTMNGKTGGTTPTFTITYSVVVQ
ncbi:MAG TPA: CshA/CshB family fibrillar adhesin-related protein [Gammaproteobacteria bacterium]|jgi:uncharacterized repeat protein (TIGR01451 family)